jgi:hypothetical protein
MTDNDFLNFGNVPMTVEGVRHFLQDYFGKPISVRMQGSRAYKCPYCRLVHRCEPGPGYVQTDCKPKNKGEGIVIGDRTFSAAYGVTIVEYVEEAGKNNLIFK